MNLACFICGLLMSHLLVRKSKKDHMHSFDTGSSCSNFDEDLADGMPLLISLSLLSVYVINSFVNADARVGRQNKKPQC